MVLSIACLLTTDTGDAGSSPHVARWFSMIFQDKIDFVGTYFQSGNCKKSFNILE